MSEEPEELLNRSLLKDMYNFLLACLGIGLSTVLFLAGVCGLPKRVVRK